MKIGLAALSLFVLASCEFVSEVHVPEIPPHLVVNSLFHPDSTWYVYVSRHRHILQSAPSPPPENVILTLEDDNGMMLTLDTGWTNKEFRQFAVPITPVAGRTYTVRASASGFPNVDATSVAPSRVDLLHVEMDSSNMIPGNYNGPGSTPIEFTFQDPPGRGDYYIVTFYIERRRPVWDQAAGTITYEYYWSRCWLRETVPTGGFSELEKPIEALTDELFDGQLRTVRLHVSKSWWSGSESGGVSWRFHLTHANEEYYKYVRTVRLQAENRDNPLAQPVQIFGNINGGFGIFVGSSTSTWVHNR
jgi:hypothetical protein